MTIQSVTNAPVSMMLPLTSAVDQLNAQNTALQAELSSGVVSSSYAGLGDRRYQALDLQPQLSEVAAWQQNVTSAQNTLLVTQTAMSRITGIATALQTSLISLQGDQSVANVSAAAAEARSSLNELGSLLNARNGSQYVFGGNASDTAPVVDPSDITGSPLFQSISASVASVSTTGAAAVETATVAAASDNAAGQSVFSPALSVDGVAATSLTHRVTVGEQEHVAVGLVATQGIASSAASTGSSIRDLMRALAVVGSLDQADATSTGFSTLVSDTATQVVAVNGSLIDTVARLGQTQSRLASQSTMLSSVSDALTTQLGTIKNSDSATLSTQISATQNQLTASYTLIADMKGMSLAAYL